MGDIKSVVVKVLLLFLSVVTMPAFAQTGTASGTIQNVLMYGNGMVLITGFYFSGATCTNNGAFYISESHPQYSRLLAALLAARATSATIDVIAKIDSCWYPHITEDSSTYFVVHP